MLHNIITQVRGGSPRSVRLANSWRRGSGGRFFSSGRMLVGSGLHWGCI